MEKKTKKWNKDKLGLFLQDQMRETAAKMKACGIQMAHGCWVYNGLPSSDTTTFPPNFSARVERSWMSSKPFTCHSCLIPEKRCMIALDFKWKVVYYWSVLFQCEYELMCAFFVSDLIVIDTIYIYILKFIFIYL